MLNHYLSIRPWTLDFVAALAKIDTTIVWIRIPSLNVGYYDEDVLMAMAKMVGRLVHIDPNILRALRGKFSRFCVEINLNQPIANNICLDDQWYKIEYEGVHIICARCGCYGHYTRECASVLVQSAAQQSSLNSDGADGVNNSMVQPPLAARVSEPQSLHGE